MMGRKNGGERTCHGKTNSRAYRIWAGMRMRCSNPKHRTFEFYGARGISVAPEWHDFNVFLSDMGDPPPGASIDRIDNDGPYCKANCRWADDKQQRNNRRNNVLIEWKGKTQTLAQWCAEFGVDYYLVKPRVRIMGWDLERALFTPPGRGRPRRGS